MKTATIQFARKSSFARQHYFCLLVFAGGAGGSWQLANLGPRIAKGDMAPGFMIDLVLKDLAIVAEAARARGVPLAGTALAETYFRSAQAQGAGKKGTQAMSQTLESLGHFRYKG